jgi:phosphopantetheinyl transferase (holo-ACP synthase)
VIGNDVVDLGDPAIEDHHRIERFVARVCADEERPRVRSKADLWSLFAAKEAAYKALVMLGRDPGFSHRAIVVAADRVLVRWGDYRLALRLTGDDDHVHAVAWDARLPEPVAHASRTPEPPGDAARALACELTARATGLDVAALRVVRDPSPEAWDGFGPPRVERLGAPIGVEVSLSHDGRFVAAAVRVRSP